MFVMAAWMHRHALTAATVPTYLRHAHKHTQHTRHHHPDSVSSVSDTASSIATIEERGRGGRGGGGDGDGDGDNDDDDEVSALFAMITDDTLDDMDRSQVRARERRVLGWCGVRECNQHAARGRFVCACVRACGRAGRRPCVLVCVCACVRVCKSALSS